MKPTTDNTLKDVIGLLPAGGQAARLGLLPCSKEIFPVGFEHNEGMDRRPKAVCLYTLDAMRAAGITTAYVIVQPGKWDILAYLGDGHIADMHIAFRTVHVPDGMPFTLDQAYPFVQNARVALGLPDTIFRPQDAFARLLERQTVTNADVVLGLFPAENPARSDMVDYDEEYRVRRIRIKQAGTALDYAWMLAVWTLTFTEYLHAALPPADRDTPAPSEDSELQMGEIFQAAADDGLHVVALPFPDGTCLDIGTPEALARAVSHYANN